MKIGFICMRMTECIYEVLYIYISLSRIVNGIVSKLNYSFS